MAKVTTKVPISVVDRRLKSGAIFGLGSKAIPLVEPRQWSLFIANTELSNSRLWEIQAEKGWIYVTPEDLAVKPEEIGFRELDGHIVRGVHGQEVLMKMPQTKYAAVQKMKDAHNRETTYGVEATKRAIANAARAEPGASGPALAALDRAQLTVIDSTEHVSLEK